ncbi:MAG TPA: EAL domain-containing protein [Burkholderiaceae bacterium]|nr:EAL domain-containing protein [Burkholderiaceae bacterium]
MTTPPISVTGLPFENLLRDEQVRQHAAVWPTAVAGSAAIGVVVAVVLWKIVVPVTLAVWLLLLVCALAGRILVGRAYARLPSSHVLDPIWIQRHRLVSFLHGCVWALVSIMLFPTGNVTAQMFIVFALVGICISSLSAYAFDLTGALLFCVPSVLALAIRLFTIGEETSVAMGVMVVMFMGYVAVVGVRSYRSVRETVALRGAEARQSRTVLRSEQQLLRAEKLAQLGSFEWYPQSGELHWSDQHFRLWGLEPGHVVPSHAVFLNGIHPDDRGRQEHMLQSALKAECRYECSYRVCWPDGTIRDIHGIGDVTFDRAGQATLMVGSVQDITERRRSESSLAEKHHVLTLLLKTTEQGFWFIDANGVGTDANPALCDLLGRSKDEIVGRSVFDFFEGADLQILRDQVAARRAGQKGGYEVGLIRPDGSRRHCMNNATPMQDSHGAFIGSIGIWTDLTERRRAEEALEVFQLVTNSITDSVAVIDEHQVYQMVNDAWCHSTQVARSDAIGHSSMEILPGLDSPARSDAIRQCIELQEPQVQRYSIDALALADRLLETTYYPFSPVAGRLRQVVMVTRDITVQERSRQQLADSAENLRRTFNATADGMFAYDASDPDGRLLFANDRFFEMWNMTAGNASTVGRADVIAAARKLFIDPDLEVRRINAILGMDVPFEDRLTLNDGRILQRRSVPLAGNSGVSRVWSFRDVTREVQAVESLRESDQQQRILLDAFPGFIGVTDANYFYTHVNKRLADQLGMPAEQIVGRHMRDVIGEDRFAENVRLFGNMKEGESAVVERHFPETNDRPGVDIQLTHVVGTAQGDDGSRFFGFGVDISDLKRAQEALLTAKGEADQANLAKSSFVANVSHELRTPLNAILGFSQLLRADGQLTQTTSDYSAEIERAGIHLLSLVDDLIDLGRVEAGHLELNMSRVPVDTTIKESLSLIAPLAAQQGTRIIYSAGDGRNAVVLADAIRLRQIIINLLSNAIKYNRPNGSVTVTCSRVIHLPSGLQRPVVRVSVTDTGFGIAPERADRVFAAFDRLGAERSAVEGTGIGLAITKRLTEAMGGQIGYISRQGDGCTFWVDLPQAMPASDGSQRVGPPLPVVEKPALAMPVPRVLVAEDYVPNQTVLRLQLASLGCEVEVVNDGSEAFARWKSAHFDLVLSDLDMPEMNGYQLGRRIREAERVKGGHVPIIALSAAVAGDERARCLRSGLDDLLSKPISLEGLSGMLVRHIGKDGAWPEAAAIASASPAVVDVTNTTLDLDRLYQYLGRISTSQARELLATFMNAATQGLQELGLRPHDAARWAREMHRQHSSALTVGALHYADLTGSLEQLARTGQVGDTADALRKLESLLNGVAAQVAQLDDFSPSVPPVQHTEAAELLRSPVLVVDDDPVILMQMKQMLGGMGVARVLTARNGLEAIVLMNRRLRPPEVVVCDLNMPEMDGVEMIRRLGQSDFSGGLILMSGANEQLLPTVGKLAELQGLSVLGQIRKPVSPESIRGMLRQVSTAPARRPAVESDWAITPDVIRAGIAAKEFSVWFQPKVDAISLKPVGVEALARWQTADGRYIPPDLFVVAAEAAGIIAELSNVLLKQALEHGARMHLAGFPIKISVNLSALWLDDLSLPDLLLRQTRDVNLTPSDVILEVTETGVTKDVATALDVLSRLRLKGFGLSIDDFGIGYSSFEQLGRIPFTEMKLDRSFVNRGKVDSAARAILESSLDMAQKLKLSTVAEGVETQAELDLMRTLGCNSVQGYLIARPMPIAELIEWLRQRPSDGAESETG